MPSSRRRLTTPPSRRSDEVEIAQLSHQFTIHLRALGRSEKTILHYQDSLRLLQRFMADAGRAPVLDVLDTPTLNAFATWRRSTPLERARRGSTTRSEVGVHGVLADTKAFLRYLAEEELLTRRVKVPVPKLPQQLFPVLTDEELAQVFACDQLNPRTEIGRRNRALVAFMLDTGVRLAEVAQLRLEDLRLRDGEAKVRGKGQKERLVFFSDAATEAIRRWLGVRGEASGSLFWLEPAGVRMVFYRIQRETGLPRFTPHQLRHTCFTNLVRQSVDLHTIKRIAGHASVITTERYLAMSGEEMKAKHKLASPFDRIAGPREKPVKRRLKTA